MKALKLLGALGLICFVIGCTADENAADNNHDRHQETVDYNKIAASHVDQNASNQAKDSLKQLDDVTAVKAVNTDKQLIAAFEIKHHKRFQLSSIRKDVQTKLQQEFPTRNVEVSTDQKLVMEIEKLEEKIDENNISPKKLQQNVEHLITLMHEKT